MLQTHRMETSEENPYRAPFVNEERSKLRRSAGFIYRSMRSAVIVQVMLKFAYFGTCWVFPPLGFAQLAPCGFLLVASIQRRTFRVTWFVFASLLSTLTIHALSAMTFSGSNQINSLVFLASFLGALIGEIYIVSMALDELDHRFQAAQKAAVERRRELKSKRLS